MNLKVLLPKKFFCRFSLKHGSLFVGIFFACVMVCCTLALVVGTVKLNSFTNDSNCQNFVWRNTFSFYVTACVYSVFLLLIDVWFIWGVRQEKTSVILSWIVITSMWLAQVFCLLIVMIIVYSVKASYLAWLCALIFGLLAIALLLYFVLVALGYWIQLKTLRNYDANETAGQT